MTKHAVLIFSTAYFPLVGGAEVAMKEETDRLLDWEFDLICARIRPGLPNRERIGRVTVHRVGFGKPVDKYLLPFFGAWHALWMRPRRKIVWSLLASYGGFSALFYCWLCPRTKLLLTLQEGDPLEHYRVRTGILTFLHRSLFRRSNVVHAISRFLAEWANKMGFPGTPAVIPNGVDIERFSASLSQEERKQVRGELGFAPDDCVLVTASRLSLKNGIDDMIRSLTHLPLSFKALIIGDGEDREKLEALTQEKKLTDRVLFLGSRSHEELPRLLQASDIFIRPSLSEGLGNSFLEAMAAGLPIIGTPVGGIPDFLLDGETGVFCQPRNPESIADAVQRIQQESGLRAKLIQQGEILVKNGYEWTNIAKRIEELFKDLVRLLQ